MNNGYFHHPSQQGPMNGPGYYAPAPEQPGPYCGPPPGPPPRPAPLVVATVLLGIETALSVAFSLVALLFLLPWMLAIDGGSGATAVLLLLAVGFVITAGVGAALVTMFRGSQVGHMITVVGAGMLALLSLLSGLSDPSGLAICVLIAAYNVGAMVLLLRPEVRSWISMRSLRG